MSGTPWIAVVFTLFAWWFSTGAILWVVRRSVDGRALVAFWSLPVLLGGLAALWASLEMTGPGGAYLGFVAALGIWGWIELAFLAGVITGPNATHCPAEAVGVDRFLRACGTIAYHEMLLVLVAIALCLASLGHPNMVGAWTFGLLFAARVSAKLNLFFGVPKFNAEFLPEHLAHLPSHFKIARMNWVFPISVTALSAAVAWFVAGAGHAPTPAGTAAQTLLATLTALALLEHWLLVLPLPDAKLWRWMLPDRKPLNLTTKREGRHGV